LTLLLEGKQMVHPKITPIVLREMAELIGNAELYRVRDYYMCNIFDVYGDTDWSEDFLFTDFIIECGALGTGALSDDLRHAPVERRNDTRVMFLLFMAEVLEDNAL
jgi:hypothetical protein